MKRGRLRRGSEGFSSLRIVFCFTFGGFGDTAHFIFCLVRYLPDVLVVIKCIHRCQCQNTQHNCFYALYFNLYSCTSMHHVTSPCTHLPPPWFLYLRSIFWSRGLWFHQGVVEVEPEVEDEVDPELAVVPPVVGAEDDVGVFPFEDIAGPSGAEKTKGSIVGVVKDV